MTETRNARNVWTIAAQPYAGAHFATMPRDLAARCIKAGTSAKGCCSRCGAPWVRLAEKRRSPDGLAVRVGGYPGRGDGGVRERDPGGRGGTRLARVRQVGAWAPACSCAAAVVPCTVLDPFGGAGTTGLAADRLQRDAILLELSAEYAEMARARIRADAGPLLAAVS